MFHGFLLLTAISATGGFNIFTKPVRHFQKEDDNLFGQTVIESQQGILVASPSSTAQLMHCTPENEKCTEVVITDNVRNGLKPIVSAAKKTDGHQHMFCQQVRKRKAVNEDLNGDCALFHDLRKIDGISPSSLVVEEMKRDNNNSNSNNNNDISSRHRKEHVKIDSDQPIHRQRGHTNGNNNNNKENEDEEDARTEIAFVLDGSGSIEAEDFERAKDFISNIMKKVWETCFNCDFAIVQYGDEIRTELSLLENDNGTKAIEKVKSIKQIMHVTKTASAINHVLEHVFVPENGSQENAKKMIIVITDGSIFRDPMVLTDVLNSPKIKNILRFAIGVGEVLKQPKGVAELKEIASDPDEEHLFMVNDYTGLDKILSNFEKSITGIEGIQQGAGFHFELAEAGFSSHFAHDGNLLFGAVGAYDWSGGLILKTDEQITFLNDSSTGPRFSYLGYSVSSALGLTETLYISGAPRYNLTGSVLVFSSKSHELIQTLPGDQVGSYFGAVLCALDFDKDGKTDYLLVGAPYYHVKGEEGKVYVYKLNQAQGRFDMEGTEWRGKDGHVFAMFGSAIADIGDIDGNRFNDVAVGAPLEEEGASGSSGSIYIYNGYEEGIRPRFSQRVSAAELGTRLRFFGRSVSGVSQEKTTREHISVGSEGGVTLLQAIPVIVFRPKMTVFPLKMPSMDTEKNKQYSGPVTLKICFNTMRGSIRAGELPISYQVDLDADQARKRLSFPTGVSKSDTFFLTPDKECLDTLSLKFTGCHDCFSPIVIKLSYALRDSPTPQPPLRILDKFSPTEFSMELPFERDCQRCVAEVSLAESGQSADTIVLGHTQNHIVGFSLTNRGDSSYMTTLVFTYPNILLYNKVQPDSLIVCRNEERGTDGESSQLKCNIMHPVLKHGAHVSFNIYWQVMARKTELRMASILANLTCANNGGQLLDYKSYKSVVKNALKVHLIGKTNSEFLNVNKDISKKNSLTFKFEIYGENKYDAKLSVNIRIVLQATQTDLFITEISKEKCKFIQGHLKTAEVSYLIRCAVGELQDTISIKAEALVKDVEGSSEMIEAEATLEFDSDQYENVEKDRHSGLVQVRITKPETVKSTATVIGGSIGGLLLLAIIIAILIKCGFFRSRYSVEQPGAAD